MIEAYFECRKHKRNKPAQIKFEADYEAECLRLTDEVNQRTYRISPLTEFPIMKPKPRQGFSSRFKDRVVQTWLVTKLMPIMESLLIDDNYNCRKHKGALYAQQSIQAQGEYIQSQMKKQLWILKIDIKGFFMSLNMKRVKSLIVGVLRSHYDSYDKEDAIWVAELLCDFRPEKNCVRIGKQSVWDKVPAYKMLQNCTEGFGGEIGSVTMQCFALFYLALFDRVCKRMAKGYGRFVDDIVILDTHRQLIKIRAFVRRWAEFMGVEFNPGKEYFQPWCRGLEFVGGYIKKNRLYAGNRIIGNCETYIARMSTNDSSEVFAAHINSYFGLMRNHDSFSQRRRLMNLIPKERWKEIYFDRCLVCRARKNVKQLNDKEDDSKKCD